MNEKVNASITSTKRILTQSTKQRSKKKPEEFFTSKNEKNDTVLKTDKSGFVTVTNISNKITQIEHPSEINIHR